MQRIKGIYIENTGKVELIVKTVARLNKREVVAVKQKKLPTPIMLPRDYIVKNVIDIAIRQVKINGKEVFLHPMSNNTVTFIEGIEITREMGAEGSHIKTSVDEDDEYDLRQITEVPYWKAKVVESVQVPPSSVINPS